MQFLHIFQSQAKVLYPFILDLKKLNKSEFLMI